MNTREDLIGYDFQGWPIFKMNLKEMLIALGGKEKDNQIIFDCNDTSLKSYPNIFLDDGMAYGVDGSYVIDAYNRSSQGITIFRLRKPTSSYLNIFIKNGMKMKDLQSNL